jgi:hypothetical protein
MTIFEIENQMGMSSLFVTFLTLSPPEILNNLLTLLLGNTSTNTSNP